MGVTIHYNGKLDDRARLAELLDAARLYCAEQRWGCLEIEERITGSVERTVELDGDAVTRVFPIDDILRGLVIAPHPRAGPLWLTFNMTGELAYHMPLDDSGTYWEHKTFVVETQSSGVEMHAALCDFFHWLQENFMPRLNLYDETGYFESRDENQLARAFDALNIPADDLPEAFENQQTAESDSVGFQDAFAQQSRSVPSPRRHAQRKRGHGAKPS